MRPSVPMAALLLGLTSAGALAAGVTVTKTSAVVADGISLANPKLLPGATVEYSLALQNGASGVVRSVVVTDRIDPQMKLKFDYGSTGSGPIDFADGGILGLLGSGLTYVPSSVAYSRDGTNFTYTPVPVGGYDANVRAIKVTLTPVVVGGSFTSTGSLRLRYRTVVL